MPDVPVDDRGIPITEPGVNAAPHAPSKACELCYKGTPANGMDPWEWCQEMDTCAATIDWDRIYGDTV